jgi:hypothetical protein
MPPWLWVFFIGSAIAHGHTVVGSIKGVDPNVEHKYSKSVREFRVWTAPRWDGVADKNKGCDVRYFALATGVTSVRLIAENQEQILDRSWTFDYRVDAGESMTAEFWFVDPISRETLAYRKVKFNCHRSGRPNNYWEQQRNAR